MNHWIEYWPVEGHGIQEYLPSTECPPRAKSLKYIFIFCWGSEQVTSTWATMSHSLFWIEVAWEAADARRKLWSFPVPLKAENKSLTQKMPSLPLEVERHPYHQRMWIQSWKVCINKPCYFIFVCLFFNFILFLNFT